MNSVEKRAILGVGGIFALRMIGLFMIVPVFSVYGDNYAHATPFLIGLAVGIYGLGQAIFQIPMSLAADKFPRKPINYLFGSGAICARWYHCGKCHRYLRSHYRAGAGR